MTVKGMATLIISEPGILSTLFCRNGNLEIITFLVDKCHCDVNATNTSKKTPLHQACQ